MCDDFPFPEESFHKILRDGFNTVPRRWSVVGGRLETTTSRLLLIISAELEINGELYRHHKYCHGLSRPRPRAAIFPSLPLPHRAHDYDTRSSANPLYSLAREFRLDSHLQTSVFSETRVSSRSTVPALTQCGVEGGDHNIEMSHLHSTVIAILAL